MTSTRSEAAAAVRIGAALALRKRAELLGLLRPCFARTEPWLQAGKYVSALASELPRVNGWSIARHAGDRTPDKTQRLLNHAGWDTSAAMSVVRRFAAAGPGGGGAGRRRRDDGRRGRRDRAGKAGEATAGVKRQYMGCAGRVANGINTVHLCYVREKTGHALIGARQWIPGEHIDDPVRSLVTGLPLDLEFRTKGQLAIDICTDVRTPTASASISPAGTRCTAAAPSCGSSSRPAARPTCCGCLELHDHAGRRDEADLRGGGPALLKDKRRWEVRSAGNGSKGERWYAWAWIATASPRHHLLVRRHLKTGELAFHYCYVPEGQLLTKTRLIRAAGLRWPVEEDFAFGKDCFGLDQCQARLYTAIARHIVLVMAALAICAVTAALLGTAPTPRHRPRSGPTSRHPPSPA